MRRSSLQLRALILSVSFGSLIAVIAASRGDLRRAAYSIELIVATAAVGHAQLFFDRGHGFNETDSHQVRLTGSSAPQRLKFPLSPGELHALRFDPPSGAGEVTLIESRIVNHDGSTAVVIPPEATRARVQIASLQRTEDGRVLISPVAGAPDPSVDLAIPPDLFLEEGARIWLPLAASAFATSALLALALFAPWGHERNRTAAGWLREWAERRPLLASALWVVPVWWCALIALPLPPDDNLDASWQMTLIHAHLQDLQFARDLIFTAGPWGFLFSHFYLEPAITAKLGWEVFGKLALAIAFVGATSGIAWSRRGPFLMGVVLLGGLVLDTWLILLVALLVLNVLLRADASRFAQILALLTLTFIGYVKFTLLVLGAAGTLVAVVALAWRGRWRAGLVVLAAYLAGLLGWWLAAGQNLVRLPRFFRLSLELAEGYPGAMSLEGNPGVFGFAFAVILILALYLFRQARRCAAPDRSQCWPQIAVSTGVLYVVWKHGLTRADGHALIFFFAAGLLAIVLPAFVGAAKRFQGIELIGVLCLVGAWCVDDTIVARSTEIANGRARSALHSIVTPRAYLKAWRMQANAAQQRLELPDVRAQVGPGTVDSFRHHQGRLMAMGLNYRPRIVIQGYSAYTPELLQRNLGWLQRSDRAASYLLANYETIDGRFPTLDDALVLADLPRRYATVLRQERYLLLERRADQPPADGLPRRPVAIDQPGYGRDLALPPIGEHPLLLTVHASLTELGAARSLLYRPPELRIVVTQLDGQEKNFRLIPGMARAGFLIQPFVETLEDLDRYLAGDGSKWLRSVRVEPLADEGEFWRPLALEVHELTANALPGYTNAAVVHSGTFNLPPVRVDLPIRTAAFSEGGRPALLAHSPGELEFELPTAIRRLEGWYGIREGAYTGDAQTDGVVFQVELVHPDGTRRLVWERLVDPLSQAGDRGPLELTIVLPEAPPGSRLVLITDPGSSRDTRWDWSYWSALRFSQ